MLRMVDRISARRIWVALLSLPIHIYRWCISPFLPPRCRFMPSCSAYALEALKSHGPVRGGWLSINRICRCTPWGGCGFDPVPPARHTEYDQGTIIQTND